MPKPLMPSAALAPAFTADERERQRVAHLVMGAPRPKAGANRVRKGKAPAVIPLAPGIEERVALRERWSRKAQGTPETHEHAAAEASREGALARLVQTGAIDLHQLAAAQEIQEAHRSIVADVSVRTAKLEPRGSGGPDAAAAERISAVIRERAYTRWREAMHPHAPMLLAIIVDDLGVTAAARRWRMSNRRARTILVTGLQRWHR
ncbi:hypothetical protein [Sphingomonas sp. 3-13AW]|uniref:hypothetical protein n=1 Tax=Sphingomonas sp. 3-13AW TaxID=3050450 RepID=UPI003BB68BFB